MKRHGIEAHEKVSSTVNSTGAVLVMVAMLRQNIKKNREIERGKKKNSESNKLRKCETIAALCIHPQVNINSIYGKATSKMQ